MKSLDAYNHLQHDLFLLQEWAIVWQMIFNPFKYEDLMVTNKNSLIYTVKLQITHVITLNKVSCAKYLVIIFYQKLANMERTHEQCIQ